MATFGFGAMPAAGAGATGVAAAYRLHIQEIWRIALEGEILVGYGDYFFPPRDSRVARGDFVARDAPRTRRDDLIDDWVAHDPDGPHVVAAVRGTRGGRPRDHVRRRLRARDVRDARSPRPPTAATSSGGSSRRA